MSELELREQLSRETVDMLAETVVRLLRLITKLEMEVQMYAEDKKAGINPADVYERVFTGRHMPGEGH